MAKKKGKTQAAIERQALAEKTERLREQRASQGMSDTRGVFARTAEEDAEREAIADEAINANPLQAMENKVQFLQGRGFVANRPGGPARVPRPTPAPRVPRVPEAPHPSTHPPRLGKLGEKPTLGPAVPEAPPALPSGAKAPAVSRTPRADMGRKVRSGQATPAEEAAYRDWMTQGAAKFNQRRVERGRPPLSQAAEAKRAVRQQATPEEVDMSHRATMERALRNKGGGGDAGGSGGGGMEGPMVEQEYSAGDDPQGLTSKAWETISNAAALGKPVTSPAIEENNRAIEVAQEAAKALAPNHKFSRDGIPEGLDHVQEMERLSALIQGNRASANDIDNYITLQVAQQTAKARAEAGASGSGEESQEYVSTEGESNAVEGPKPQPQAATQASEAPARTMADSDSSPAEGGRRVVRSGGSGNAGATPPAAATRQGGGGGSSKPKPPVEPPVQPERPVASPTNSGVTTGPQNFRSSAPSSTNSGVTTGPQNSASDRNAREGEARKPDRVSEAQRRALQQPGGGSSYQDRTLEEARKKARASQGRAYSPPAPVAKPAPKATPSSTRPKDGRSRVEKAQASSFHSGNPDFQNRVLKQAKEKSRKTRANRERTANKDKA